MSPLKSGCGWSETGHHMHNAIELRNAKRYRLSAPALFLWALQDGRPQSGQGVTRDINTFGVYVLTDALPPVGALVQMEIALPRLKIPVQECTCMVKALSFAASSTTLPNVVLPLRRTSTQKRRTWFCRSSRFPNTLCKPPFTNWRGL